MPRIVRVAAAQSGPIQKAGSRAAVVVRLVALLPADGGTMIVDPNGAIVAEAATEGDELVVADCDLDLTRFGKETVFDFARHRRVEHYGRITSQTGVVLPPEQ